MDSHFGQRQTAVLFANNSSPMVGLLDLAMCVTSCVRPHLYVLTNSGAAWVYSTLCSGEVARVFTLCGPTLGTWNSHPTPFTGSEPHIRQSSQVNCAHILLIDSCSALSISPANQCPLLPPISMVSLVLWGVLNLSQMRDENFLHEWDSSSHSTHGPIPTSPLVVMLEIQGHSTLKSTICSECLDYSLWSPREDIIGRCVVQWLCYKILNGKFFKNLFFHYCWHTVWISGVSHSD